MTRFAELTPLQKNELWAILALRHADGVGTRRARQLLDAFGTAHAAAEACLADPSAWTRERLTPPKSAAAFASGAWREAAGAEWAALKSPDARFLFFGGDAYPDCLSHLEDPPLLLYFQGDERLLRGPAVAVVGARLCTPDGLRTAALFARAFAAAGVAVVSGMARGIDRAAHIAALSGPGSSIAVLGTGIDIVYPPENADLRAALASQGLLISEFPPGTQPAPSHFPVRNRLISGLAQGVLVVEAAGRSGSLITARLAFEQGRDVFAVPGKPTDPMSEGCRDLIRRGAGTVFTADDVLRELAPLLCLEARRALAQRDREAEEAARGRKAKKRPAPEPEDIENAQDLLPQSDLPWTAPALKKNRKNGGRNAPRPPAAVEAATSEPAAAEPAETEPAKAAANSRKAAAPATGAEARIAGVLTAEARHIDELARELGMEAGALSAALTMMELRGLARREPGMRYALPTA